MDALIREINFIMDMDKFKRDLNLGGVGFHLKIFFSELSGLKVLNRASSLA